MARPNSNKSLSKPWRRWLRFGLRSLLIFMTLLAVGLGLVISKAREQQLAVDAILNAGGRVRYDFEPNEAEYFRRDGQRLAALIAGKPAPATDDDEPWEPDWLRAIIGLDYFHEVKEVALLGPRATDNTMDHVKRLSGVERLLLHNTRVTNDGLVNIRRLKDLQSLRIEKGLVTDAGLVHIGKLTNLTGLAFTHVQVTDDGLSHLKDLHNLTDIAFESTAVTQTGAEQLRRNLPKCRPAFVYP